MARTDFAADVARLLATARAPRRLSRTERAAAELALCVLRGGDGLADAARARDALRIGGLHIVAHAALFGAMRDARFIRARLALYLRALLRADRGDCGSWRCWCLYGERRNCPPYAAGRRGACGALNCGSDRGYTPLWQQAGEARR